jgi:Chalcone isomerase-like
MWPITPYLERKTMRILNRFSLSLPMILLIATLQFASVASAQPVAPALSPVAIAELPPVKARGGGLLRVFGFQVYKAFLWTPDGNPFDRTKPYALDIEYLRNFTAKALAERSIDEMRGQGVGGDDVYPKWLAEMQRVFADVKPGDRLTGVVTTRRSAKFFYNGMLRGEVSDPAFADAFFGIWLNEKTSQPAFREKLLGMN